MKTFKQFRILFVLALLPALVLATNGVERAKYTKEKTYHKEYDVNKDALLKIDNTYGNIDVITWNENRVVIDVTITTSGNDEDKVENKLAEISVEFEASNSLVSAKTKFNNKKSWWNWGKSNIKMDINYVVKMPISNSVDLSNDYGSINLDKLEGHAKISCDYGKITTKELMADNNIINFDYTNNSYFEYIKTGKISADYSGFTIAKTNAININADYTKSKIEIAENVDYNCDYGAVTIDKVNSVVGNGDYLTVRIGDVYNNINIRADYGSLKIQNMTANAGDITINSDYMKTTIGFAPEYSFKFKFDLEYASLNTNEELSFTVKNTEMTDKYYEGYFNDSNSKNMITINSDYGSVTLKKN